MKFIKSINEENESVQDGSKLAVFSTHLCLDSTVRDNFALRSNFRNQLPHLTSTIQSRFQTSAWMSHKSRPPLTDRITVPRTYRKRRSTKMNPKMAVANASVASRQKNWRQFPFAVGASFRIERRHELSTTQNRTQNATGPKDKILKDKSPNPTAFSVTDVDRSSPRSAKTTIPGRYPRRVSQQCGKYTSRAASSVFDVRERYETWHKSDCHADISHPSTWALCIVSSRPPPVMGDVTSHPSKCIWKNWNLLGTSM